MTSTPDVAVTAPTLAAALEAAADAVAVVQQRFRKLGAVSADGALAAAVALYAAVAPRPAPRSYFEAVTPSGLLLGATDFQAETRKMVTDQAAERAAREATQAAMTAAAASGPAAPPEPNPVAWEVLVRTNAKGGRANQLVWARRVPTDATRVEWVYFTDLSYPSAPPTLGAWGGGSFGCTPAAPGGLDGRFRPPTAGERAVLGITAPPGELTRLAEADQATAFVAAAAGWQQPEPEVLPTPAPADPAVGYGMGVGHSNGSVVYRIVWRVGGAYGWAEFARPHVGEVSVTARQCREYFRPPTAAERAANNLPAAGPVEAALWPSA